MKPQILSLGGGVQSSTLLLMSHVGEIDKLDAAFFADTRWERNATYQKSKRRRGKGFRRKRTRKRRIK